MSSALQNQLQSAIEDRYTLEREVGEGGMATVYLAHDRKHDRPVALKVLKPELGAVLGAERFLGEIRVTANLQHPHLLPLFDSGEAAGLLYYVMPFVAGESLRARLSRERQLSVSEAVRIAVAVAGALDYAHRQGIIHRDLKPENILLHEGQPLVADFGIALAVSRAGGERVTNSGIALGTPQYMSPEQAAGDRVIDGRSDIYALGAVLYEMLTGDPPHSGSNMQAVIARVLTETPRPIRATRASVPENVELAVMRALERVPADRFDSAREFAAALSAGGLGVALGEYTAGARPAFRTGGEVHSRRRDPALLATAAVAILAIGAAGWLWLGRRSADVPDTVRFVVSGLPDQAGPPYLTPDGKSIVYVGTAAGKSSIFVRRIDQLQSHPLPGTDGANSLFFSPDGRWIGFADIDFKLKKVPIDGGVPTMINASSRFGSSSWGPGDVIVTERAYELSWVSAAGGAVHPLTRLDTIKKEDYHFLPLVLPGGRAVVFTVRREHRGGAAESQDSLAYTPIDVDRATPSDHVLLGVGGRYAIGVVDGWLLFAGEDRASILAVRFDAKTGRVSGTPVTVLQELDGLIRSTGLSQNGTLIYTRSGASTNDAKLVDVKGTAQPLVGTMSSGPYMNPRLSPDGRRLAIQGRSPQGSDIWIYDIATGAPTRLTLTGSATLPAWTPDGQRIMFISHRKGGSEFWWVPFDGSAPAEKLFEGDGIFQSVTFQQDGRTLLFHRHVNGAFSIWTAALSGDHTLRPVVKETFDNYMPALSPNGRWLAYASNESGADEIYVRPYPGPGSATPVSDGGGREPMWARDGRRLFYRNDRGLNAATISPASSFAVLAHETLFKDGFDGKMLHANYDVMRNGKGFVMIGTDVRTTRRETIVVVNWLPELRARLAAAH